MSFGSLGLFRQLSALGKAATKGSAADLNKRAKRLPVIARPEFEALRKAEKEKLDAARAASQRAYEEFFAKYHIARPDYRTERAVVAAFVFEQAKSGAGMTSDGAALIVNGREVARRPSVGSKFVEVCPGKFGEDKTSRRAANAILDIMGAGLRVDDRGDQAFIHPKSGRGGLVVSPTRCYTVEMRKAILDRAAAVRNRDLIKERKSAYAEGGEIEKYYAEQQAAEYKRLRASEAIDGMHRRRHPRRRR